MKRSFPFGWVAAGLTLFGVSVLGASPESSGPAWLPIVVVAAIGALAVWLAWLRRVQRRRFEQELARAAARDAVLRDRITIARDLHDIVSHGLGAITVRAEAGRRLAAVDAEAPRQALADVIGLSREATAELRRLLTLLQDPDAAPLQPTPGVEDLPELIARAERQGVVVQAVVEVSTVPPGVGLTVHQVVGEALANVLRHAGPTTVRVRVENVDDMLVTHVIDDGPVPGWRPEAGAGHGLVLLRTRVELHGGTLACGPVGRGYEVRASIPLEV
ncbi:MAG: histidine kinase [Propionibacteriaceae bacterium]|nr:histidine kinase [Propionibacteriaceae bacterium]